MSVETWKAEFYPVDAVDCAEADALEHSIKKWTGFLDANYKRHGSPSHSGYEKWPIPTGSSSCALCVHHLDSYDESCTRCPLNIARGAACDREDSTGKTPPWQEFTQNDNPQPMLDLLISCR